MKLYPFSSISGMKLYGKVAGQDVFQLKIPRDDISAIATALIQEIGTDASPELMDKCRELVDCMENDTASQPGLGKFVRWCEDTFSISKGDAESEQQYFERLRDDYGSDYARRRRE